MNKSHLDNACIAKCQVYYEHDTKAVFTALIIITKMLDYMDQGNSPVICRTEQKFAYSP